MEYNNYVYHATSSIHITNYRLYIYVTHDTEQGEYGQRKAPAMLQQDAH